MSAHSSASLALHGIDVSYGARPILRGVDLTLDPGHRVGVVGPNGVGKSTLLRVAAAEIAPEAGRVVLRPSTTRVGYLRQEPERRAETVRDSIVRRTGTGAADAELTAATAALAAGDDGADDRYAQALETWLQLGTADFDARLGEVCADLGLSERLLGQPTATLSGGEAARVGLAALLLSRFDVLLLDEPTNDLDLDGLDRLERFLVGSAAAIAVVSHDRTFLQRVITDVVELDEFSRGATWFSGGWDSYLHEREVARAQAQAAYEEYDAKRAVLASRAQREREWATQGLARAKRAPSDNDKYVKAFKINQTEQLAGRAARTEKAMERLDVVDEPRQAWQLRLSLAVAPRSGAVVATLADVVVRREGFTLGPLSLTVGVGERVVIVGPNGSGKSTLVNVLTGVCAPDEGEARVGPSVVVGRVDQLRHLIDDAAEVARGFVDATGFTLGDSRTLLAKFGLGAAQAMATVGSLSPGERTRLLLALLMARGSNCLVLDEPTNHLDMAAIEQIEQALEDFPGTVLLVSHDRTLLQRVRRTRTIELANGQIVADTPE